MEIKFGTEGWRGVISDQFTFGNLRAVVRALAAFLLAHGKARQGVVVGYDTRFLSREYAQETAGVLASSGIEVFLAREPAPSPVISYSVKTFRAAAGLVITASHNPPVYNGLKIKGPHGGPAFTEMLDEIAGRISFADSGEKRAGAEIHEFHPAATYLPRVLTLVDGSNLARSGLRVVIDSMYGAGQGYLSSLLRRCGVSCQEIRTGYNPGFDGISPEPVARNMGALAAAVRGCQADLGLALDGDGDRLGVVDRDGNFVDSHHVMVIIARHLVENRHWPGGFAKTVATTEMMDKLARLYERRLHVTPVGFKHITQMFLEEELLLGGEESGGIGVRNHIPERDGTVAGLLLLDALAARNLSLSEQVAEIHELLGPHYCQRLDLSLTPQLKERYHALAQEAPGCLGRFRVTALETLDGIKFRLGKHGWVLLRVSGTEPLLRIYGESNSLRKTKEILRCVRKILPE
ncbi:MAG: phosphoglucomutase/phosphomannomutase family protein [Bacillota bacterium]|nr:phosphoglucomutase/phosphomannomutase family protein [Bacillota bacterium]